MLRNFEKRALKKEARRKEKEKKIHFDDEHKKICRKEKSERKLEFFLQEDRGLRQVFLNPLFVYTARHRFSIECVYAVSTRDSLKRFFIGTLRYSCCRK